MPRAMQGYPWCARSPVRLRETGCCLRQFPRHPPQLNPAEARNGSSTHHEAKRHSDRCRVDLFPRCGFSSRDYDRAYPQSPWMCDAVSSHTYLAYRSAVLSYRFFGRRASLQGSFQWRHPHRIAQAPQANRTHHGRLVDCWCCRIGLDLRERPIFACILRCYGFSIVRARPTRCLFFESQVSAEALLKGESRIRSPTVRGCLRPFLRHR
jgi:hypothetical protein